MRLIIMANLNSNRIVFFKIRKRGYTNQKVGERVPPSKKSGGTRSPSLKRGNRVPPVPPQYTSTNITARKVDFL